MNELIFRVRIKENKGNNKIIIKKTSQLSINITIIESSINPEYTPAITIVELCKGAEIGVGADIAFNNQEEKGN